MGRTQNQPHRELPNLSIILSKPSAKNSGSSPTSPASLISPSSPKITITTTTTTTTTIQPHQPYSINPNRPTLHSTLQLLPPSILLKILTLLNRSELSHLFDSPSRHLRCAAYWVLTERLALGLSAYYDVDPFDTKQIGRLIRLCGTVRGARDGRGGRMLVRGIQKEEIKGVNKGRDEKKGKTVDGLETLIGDVEVVKDDINKEDTGEGNQDRMTSKLDTTPGSAATFSKRPSNSSSLPDELVLQILQAQSDKLLRSLVTLEPCQLRRVSETLLFKRRLKQISKCTVPRTKLHDRKTEDGLWSSVSEKGEEYAGRRIILVRRGRSDGCKGEELELVSLGSYWKVVCENMHVG